MASPDSHQRLLTIWAFHMRQCCHAGIFKYLLVPFKGHDITSVLLVWEDFSHTGYCNYNSPKYMKAVACTSEMAHYWKTWLVSMHVQIHTIAQTHACQLCQTCILTCPDEQPLTHYACSPPQYIQQGYCVEIYCAMHNIWTQWNEWNKIHIMCDFNNRNKGEKEIMR